MKAATFFGVPVGRLYQISIHAAREGGDGNEMEKEVELPISIHAAREGGDWMRERERMRHGISIHAAREGGDCRGFMPSCSDAEFQSTPPVKAATRVYANNTHKR